MTEPFSKSFTKNEKEPSVRKRKTKKERKREAFQKWYEKWEKNIKGEKQDDKC